MHSSRRLTYWEQIKMAPFLIKRFIEDCWSMAGLCDCYITFYILSLMIYLLMPWDIIPESVYGVLGLVDDVFVVLFFMIPISRAIYAGYSRRLSAAANSIEIPQSENIQIAVQPPEAIIPGQQN